MQLASPNEPTTAEKLHQLERILASSTFRRMLKPAHLLRTLVDSEFSGVTAEEYTLGIAVFERREDWIPEEDNIVREGTRRVRKLLADYYASEGIEDRLNLEVSGYKPLFSYNPRHPVERNFRMALSHVATDPKAAFTLLDATLDLDPTHAEAFAAWAETELWRPLYGNEVGRDGVLDAVAIQTAKALACDEQCWRAHLVLGALHCCRREWDGAAHAFSAALASSPGHTQRHPWYTAFLMATGKTEEALQLTRVMASEPSNTPWPQLTYALFLYAARRFEEARTVILAAKKEHPNTWLSHVLWTCVLFGLGRSKSPVPLLGMSIPQQASDGTEVYSALCFLEALGRLDESDSDYAKVKRNAEKWVAKQLAERKTQAQRKGIWRQPKQRVADFHLAIGCMAINDMDKAIELLSKDFDHNHPMMAWLHLWPLFDPLRHRSEFQRLIARMNLP